MTPERLTERVGLHNYGKDRIGTLSSFKLLHTRGSGMRITVDRVPELLASQIPTSSDSYGQTNCRERICLSERELTIADLGLHGLH